MWAALPPPAYASARLRAAPRRAPLRVRACAAGASAPLWVDVHEAKTALELRGHVVLDVRPFREYDREHIVKPPKSCFSAPYAAGCDVAAFGAAAEQALGRGRDRGILVLTATGGDDAVAAADALAARGYTGARPVLGGWVEWRKHYTPSGRNTPPPGRWVPTGTEALKSGLNVGGAAEKYEEKLNVEDLTKY